MLVSPLSAKINHPRNRPVLLPAFVPNYGRCALSLMNLYLNAGTAIRISTLSHRKHFYLGFPNNKGVRFGDSGSTKALPRKRLKKETFEVY